MRSVETSVVVRFLVRDTPSQADAAARILREGAFVPLTVLLETAWVLGSHYGQSRDRIARALLALIDMPKVVVAQEPAVRWALERFSRKGDIGDLLNIVAAVETDAILTFDRDMVRHAAPDPPVEVKLLPS